MTRTLARIIALSALLVSHSAFANDWPNFLGPQRNGIVDSDSALRLDWELHPPQSKWTAMIGPGCSSFAVVDGKALILGNQKNRDTLWCFDASNGKVLWQHAYDEPLKAKWYSGGPSSTPTIDDDRVYIVSKSGKLFCLDLHSGRPLWQKDYVQDFQGRSGGWGWAASPLIYGKLLLIDPGAKTGALVALDKLSGKVQWSSGNDEAGYATPVLYRHKDKDAVAVFHKKALVGYDLENAGETLFRFSWRTSHGVNASNPHYREGKFFLSSGYGSGYAVIDLAKDEPEILHRDRKLILKMQTSLLIGKRIIAHFGGNGKPGELQALDFDTGESLWTASMPGDLGNAIAVGDHLIVFTDSGHVILGKDKGNAFHELGRHQALQGRNWAPPAYAKGSLFLRSNRGKVICLDIGKE